MSHKEELMELKSFVFLESDISFYQWRFWYWSFLCWLKCCNSRPASIFSLIGRLTNEKKLGTKEQSINLGENERLLRKRMESIFNFSSSIVELLHKEGFRGFYKGFGTSLMGTIAARALYMGSLEVTKSSVGTATVNLGVSEVTAAGGVSAAMAAQLVWTPIDVVSQRLMVQGGSNVNGSAVSAVRYNGGIDAFRKIVVSDSLRGLYRGFGILTLTYAPSNAV
ncbi:hypothetical protein POM88_047489 [Heracleum sosnowskyi]|uniref:Uncharacterized protein n=1 Tax=Heracleum sosnowskyi TaxID=360622 RepID=A0AAD8GTI0_9APIA|nr:hypothetical protein POM88_047489 [Heracleum sosnowskyi]